MISNDIYQLLGKLLLSIAEGELHLESIREVLFESEGFDLRKAFEILDFMSKGFVTSDDIYKFMQEDKQFTPMTCYLLLKEWDPANRGHLTIQDLSLLMLPFNCHPHPDNSFPIHKSEFALTKILKSELSYILSIEKLKSRLFKQKGFLPSSCFNVIDSPGNAYLTPQSLSHFLHNFNPNESVLIQSLLRRLDRNNDGRISYTEFIQIVTPASKVYGSEENFSSVFTTNSSAESSPVKVAKETEVREVRKVKKGSKVNAVQRFARFIMQQIMLEKELEEKRRELALRVDFSIGKLFNLFDVNGKGNVSLKDFESSLGALGIIPELNQCHLLFRQYDLDHDNQLTYWDFIEIFNPRKPEYADLISSRLPSKAQKNSFSIETEDMITDTFIVLLNIQTVTEELKQKMFTKNFNLQKIFEKIDMNGLGFLTRGCFRNLLRKFKYYATDRDLEAIMLIYDSNKDGKITYGKFVQGACPKAVNNV